MEATEARAQLLELHGLRARRQRCRQPQRRPDSNEQHGALPGTSAWLLLVRMTGTFRHGARGSRAHVILTAHSQLIIIYYGFLHFLL